MKCERRLGLYDGSFAACGHGAACSCRTARPRADRCAFASARNSADNRPQSGSARDFGRIPLTAGGALNARRVGLNMDSLAIGRIDAGQFQCQIGEPFNAARFFGVHHAAQHL